MSDAEFARNLFPEDNRLASLAEEALKNGDQDALNYLMKKNGLKPQDLKSSASGNEMAQNSDGSNEGQGSAQNTSENKSDTTGDSQDSKQQKQGDTHNKENANKATEGNDSNAQNDNQGNQGKEGDVGEKLAPTADDGQKNAEENKAGKTGQSGQGDKAGSGTADTTTSLASKKGSQGSSKDITFRKEGTPLEFVLPVNQAKAKMMQVAPAAVRGSEATIGSDAAPLEYESFVKFYFSTLSKEMQK